MTNISKGNDHCVKFDCLRSEWEKFKVVSEAIGYQSRSEHLRDLMMTCNDMYEEGELDEEIGE